MKILREIAQGAADTFRLGRSYFVLTSVIGLAGVALGIALMHALATGMESAFGIDPQAPVGSQPYGTLWVVLFVAGIPLCIYLGVVLVAGSFAAAMVALGKFTPAEALRYAFLSRYPARWLRRRDPGP